MKNQPEHPSQKYPRPELPPMKDAGDYYDNCAEEARYWRKLLREAQALGAPRHEIKFLKGRIEAAEYVGD